MKTEKILTKNNTYQKLIVLKSNRNKRHKYQEFLVEGVRNINAAAENGWDIRSLIYANASKLSEWAEGIIRTANTFVNYELSTELMKGLSGKEDTSELMAVAGMRPDSPDILKFSQNPVIALFDRPSNKGNLGTVIRSCDALGVECLILTGHSVDLYDPEVIVSSMGSFFNMQVIRFHENQMVFDFIEKMKERYPGFHTIGTTARKEYPLYQLNLAGPVLFMIGNETDGLCNAFKDCCDYLATIPMADTSYATSFNVGCAATVMFYEASRQRSELTEISHGI